jgi:L-alanine-DL-glutamate epimerase-like enolase superfamily enzyme
VTGETLDSAVAWLKDRIGPWSRRVRTLDDLRALIAAHEAEIDRNPSAFCAFELAMLDNMARRAGMSIEAFLGLKGLSRPQAVTAVSGSDNPLTFHFQAWRFWTAGMTAAKLKLSKDATRNLSRANLLSRFASVRLDGNNLWQDAESAIAGLMPLKDKAWAVEEPVRARDFAAMIRIQKETGLTIILDESLINRHDLESFLALDPHPGAFAVNLRISKMGGLLRTLDLTRRLRAMGLGRIIGAQVGETSCLARAGLALALEAAPILGFEAGYGRHLLTRDAFTPSLTFDRRGVLALTDFPVDAPGFGLAPSGLAFEMKAGPDQHHQRQDDMEAGRDGIVEESVPAEDGGAQDEAENVEGKIKPAKTGKNLAELPPAGQRALANLGKKRQAAGDDRDLGEQKDGIGQEA